MIGEAFPAALTAEAFPKIALLTKVVEETAVTGSIAAGVVLSGRGAA